LIAKFEMMMPSDMGGKYLSCIKFDICYLQINVRIQ
jgi:hypothetical protein